METNELLEILVQAGKLKQAKRHCFVEKDRQESVADIVTGLPLWLFF